jgi:hypothetical protein
LRQDCPCFLKCFALATSHSCGCRSRLGELVCGGSTVGCVTPRVRQCSRQNFIMFSNHTSVLYFTRSYSGNTVQTFMTWTTLLVQIALNFLVSHVRRTQPAHCCHPASASLFSSQLCRMFPSAYSSTAATRQLGPQFPSISHILNPRPLHQPIDFSHPPYTIVPKRYLRTVTSRRRVMFAAIALLALLLVMNLAALATQIVSVVSPDDGDGS